LKSKLETSLQQQGNRGAVGASGSSKVQQALQGSNTATCALQTVRVAHQGLYEDWMEGTTVGQKSVKHVDVQ
jgi:hypothetical protein